MPRTGESARAQLNHWLPCYRGLSTGQHPAALLLGATAILTNSFGHGQRIVSQNWQRSAAVLGTGGVSPLGKTKRPTGSETVDLLCYPARRIKLTETLRQVSTKVKSPKYLLSLRLVIPMKNFRAAKLGNLCGPVSVSSLFGRFGENLLWRLRRFLGEGSAPINVIPTIAPLSV